MTLSGSVSSLRAASVTAVRIRFRSRCTRAKIILTVQTLDQEEEERWKRRSMFDGAICLRGSVIFFPLVCGFLPDRYRREIRGLSFLSRFPYAFANVTSPNERSPVHFVARGGPVNYTARYNGSLGRCKFYEPPRNVLIARIIARVSRHPIQSPVSSASRPSFLAVKIYALPSLCPCFERLTKTRYSGIQRRECIEVLRLRSSGSNVELP